MLGLIGTALAGAAAAGGETAAKVYSESELERQKQEAMAEREKNLAAIREAADVRVARVRGEEDRITNEYKIGLAEKSAEKERGIIAGILKDTPTTREDEIGAQVPLSGKERLRSQAEALTAKGFVKEAESLHKQATADEAIDMKLKMAELVNNLGRDRLSMQQALGEMRISLLQAQAEARSARDANKPSALMLQDLKATEAAAHKDLRDAQYGKVPDDIAMTGKPEDIDRWRQTMKNDATRRLTGVRLRIAEALGKEGNEKYAYAQIDPPETAAKEFLRITPKPTSEQVAAWTGRAYSIYGSDAASAISVLEKELKQEGKKPEERAAGKPPAQDVSNNRPYSVQQSQDLSQRLTDIEDRLAKDASAPTIWNSSWSERRRLGTSLAMSPGERRSLELERDRLKKELGE